LSDLGNEFNNSLVDEITKNLAIDHQVTAGYNPSTNGKTEKANDTIKICLRKFLILKTRLYQNYQNVVFMLFKYL
jgi:hypothetical protein